MVTGASSVGPSSVAYLNPNSGFMQLKYSLSFKKSRLRWNNYKMSNETWNNTPSQWCTIWTKILLSIEQPDIAN